MKPPSSISLDLSVITIDPCIKGRVSVSQKTIDEYAQRMRDGDKFPPVVVYQVERKYILVDGLHRHDAEKKLGHKRIKVELHQGTRRGALLAAVKANHTHGLPLSNADKRFIVRLTLKEFHDFSDHMVAALCNVSQPFVGNVRRELITVISSETRTGKDGRNSHELPARRTPT